MTIDPVILHPPTPAALRDELEQLVLADLLGPVGGEEEELTDRQVRDRYLVGMLAPRRQQLVQETLDSLQVTGEDAPDDGPVDAGVSQASSMFPSSFGLTCTVDGAATAVRIAAHWGRYQRARSATLTTATTEQPQMIWKRQPMGGEIPPFALADGAAASWSPDPDQPEVRVRAAARRMGDCWSVTVFLINEQDEPERSRDTAWIFQPELRVAAPDGAPIFRRRADLRRPPAADAVAAAEDQAMAMLYRHEVEFAVGHGVAVHAQLWPADPTCATAIVTRVVPSYEVGPTISPTADEIPEIARVELDMRALAELPRGGFSAALEPLIAAYTRWIARQRTRIGDPAEGLAEYAPVAEEVLDRCMLARDRIAAGIALLDADEQAAEAFRFMNRAMWQQRVHTRWAEERRRGRAATIEELDVPTQRSWRLFQLAFILINLPALTDLRHPDRTGDGDALADLLWFPTGGGKTEAYLGLTAYTLGIRRLQGVVAGRSGLEGVAVLMRYTLRLLTLQQFQRATALICACETIRRAAVAQGDHRWGTTPFRIGLWVGERTTPNTTERSAEALKRDGGQPSAFGGSGSPHQLTHCPWCGTAIDPGKHVVVNKTAGRTLLYCGDKLGDCPFSQRQAPGEGLPVLVVDEEIYRRLPALLIATVDKFAQMPWKGPVQMLFGQVDGYCERHGFRSPEIADADRHPAKDGLPAAQTRPHGPLRPPDLIIQDELHLISGPLGTLVGLYETGVDHLSSWEVGGMRVRPKVIASTATIRRAADQMQALFLHTVAVFPPQGLDAGDNFFATQRAPGPDTPGRKYIGICASGKRLKAVLIRVYVAYLAASQRLYERYGRAADPYMTLVGYFNAMRELGGMRRLVEDDVRSRLAKTDQRGLAKRSGLLLEELTSRKGSTDIPRVLNLLETPFDPAIEAQRTQARKAGRAVDLPRPLDVLLATNMIAVGVDVSRLGLMVVAGQPKTTAEYIQATSRVGRATPGLVCTVYNWTRPRDLSHYERFEHYHATFYQHVEALSVTPFAARAIDRGLSALLVAYVRLLGMEFNANNRAGRIERSHPYITTAMTAIARRAALVTTRQTTAALIEQALKQRVDAWEQEAQRSAGGRTLGYRSQRDGLTVGLLHRPEEGPWQTFTCLNSLREVEPTVDLILDERGLSSEEEPPFVAALVPDPSAEQPQPSQ
ncbi:MAG TPA: DISARM system helicase DrmA [Herpetosiphonaceae bacterium]